MMMDFMHNKFYAHIVLCKVKYKSYRLKRSWLTIGLIVLSGFVFEKTILNIYSLFISLLGYNFKIGVYYDSKGGSLYRFHLFGQIMYIIKVHNQSVKI